jgi:hypothetical protein
MEPVTITIQDTIKAYEKVESEIRRVEQDLRDLKQLLRHTELNVVEAFERDEVTDMTYNGRRWKPVAINTISVVGREGGQALVDWLLANVPGAESKVKATMHHGSRDAMAKETFIDDEGNINIPAELAGYVQEYNDVKLDKRVVK